MLKIYCCDALYLLNSMKEDGGKVDMVLTDPMTTYNDEYNHEWLKHCFELLKDGGILCSFCSPPTLNKFIEQVEGVGFRHMQTIERMNKKTGGMEPCIIASKGEWKGGLFEGGDYEDGEPVEGFPPEAQKPVELLKNLISHFTKEGDLVIDFFLGSGTTALACKELNRKFKGCEANMSFCAVAKKRLGFNDQFQTGI